MIVRMPDFAPVQQSGKCATIRQLLMRGIAMRQKTTLILALAATAATGLLASVWAQAPQTPPAPPPAIVPAVGPADPALRALPMPSGKKMHLLPATLETTQWG